jgi:Uma2 family endonuclease
MRYSPQVSTVAKEDRRMSQPALSLTGAHDLRDIADELLTRQRVEYVHEGQLTFTAPPGFAHLAITDRLIEGFVLAGHTGASPVQWRLAVGSFPWDVPDGSRRFFIPDLAVARPGADSAAGFRERIALIAEITSPEHPDTVEHDRETKPREYARAGVPLYLLVDQELGTWTLHELIEGWPRYRPADEGAYGPDGRGVKLPLPFGFTLDTTQWPRLSAETA